MSYQKDREQFIAQIVKEIGHAGYDLAYLVLRNASTIQTCETLVCSSEAADRDRVMCPAAKTGKMEDCCCDFEYQGAHCKTPKVEVKIMRARKRIAAACKEHGITADFSGDPRGACVKLNLPSGTYNSWGGKGFCVPTRG